MYLGHKQPLLSSAQVFINYHIGISAYPPKRFRALKTNGPTEASRPVIIHY